MYALLFITFSPLVTPLQLSGTS